jgi:hypothetical protein
MNRGDDEDDEVEQSAAKLARLNAAGEASGHLRTTVVLLDQVIGGADESSKMEVDESGSSEQADDLSEYFLDDATVEKLSKGTEFFYK